jgi:hypothetical protein
MACALLTLYTYGIFIIIIIIIIMISNRRSFSYSASNYYHGSTRLDVTMRTHSVGPYNLHAELFFAQSETCAEEHRCFSNRLFAYRVYDTLVLRFR